MESYSRTGFRKFRTKARYLTPTRASRLEIYWSRSIHQLSRSRSLLSSLGSPTIRSASLWLPAMDITNMLNSKGPTAVVDSEHQYTQLTSQLNKAVHLHSRMGSETGSDLGNNSDHSSVYSSRSSKALQALPHLPNGMRYPSPSQLQHPISMLASGYPPPNLGLENGYIHGHHRSQEHQRAGQFDESSPVSGGNESVKAFACTTCNKGFARRSDLARHGEHDHPACRNFGS